MPPITLGPVTLQMPEEGSPEKGIQELFQRPRPTHIVTFNALMFMQAVKEPRYAAILSGAGIAVCDSIGVAWAIKFLSGITPRRLPGIDLLHLICREAASAGKTVFLLGAQPGIAEAAARRLQEQYPGLKIAGTHHGYFNRDDDDRVINAISLSHADILFVAMAIPSQEQWIYQHLQDLSARVVMGVGGSFDVIAGRLKRAPRWMQRWGIEWLFRVLQQPWRSIRIARLALFVPIVVSLKLRMMFERS